MADATRSPKASAPERIDRILTHEILSGAYPPGSRLPTLRELADSHQVNPSTMQRALARLEVRGLITARQGSGLLVNDPYTVADISLVSDWLHVTADDPDRAAAIVSDLLELRRVLACCLIKKYRSEVLEAVASLASGAAEVAAANDDGVLAADMAFAHLLVRSTGNMAAAAVLNSLGRALGEHPVLVEAMYLHPDENAASMMEVLTAVQAGGPEMAVRVEEAVASVDARTVANYRALLVERQADSG